jgi:hypothetical protein
MRLPEAYDVADYLAWLHSPLTQAFIEGLKEDRQAVMEAWARRAYTSEDSTHTLQLNAIGLAQVKTIDELLQGLEASEQEARELIAENQRRK